MALISVLSACSLTTPITATSNQIGSKRGESQAVGIRGTFIWFKGDASVTTAAANGGIHTVSTIDRKEERFLFFVIITTIVTGE
jgi:hypothetical protein